MMYEYYKPGKLFLGLMIFFISIFGMGYLVGAETQQDNIIILIILVLGLFLGEGLILDSASKKLDANCVEDER